MKFTLNRVNLEVIQQQVYFQNKSLDLSARAHLCLIEFLQAENSILSKEELMTTMWKEVIVSDDSLFKVIQEVRKALVSIGVEKGALKNVYGKGYQLTTVSIDKPHSTKRPHSTKYVVLTVMLLLSIGMIGFFWNGEKDEVIPLEVFTDVADSIESNHHSAKPELDKLLLIDTGNNQDKLKLSYLKGLYNYKSGNYEQSIQDLLEGVSIHGKAPSNKIIADTNLLLAKIFVYRKDKTQLKSFIDSARDHYLSINDEAGVLSADVSLARYHQSIFEFEQSIVVLNQVIATAETTNNPYHALRAHANLVYSYQQLSQTDKQLDALNQTLEMALKQSHGSYAAFAYGELSQLHMKDGEAVKSMKYAQQAINFVLAQNDTNTFQQGFSAYYNILHELGHLDLAEKYLNSAIGIQAYFNDQAILVVAEQNLARVYIEKGEYQKAQKLLMTLKEIQLTEVELITNETLLALSSLKMNDNITAYTKANQIFSTTKANDRIRFLSGIVLILSAIELEREDEIYVVLEELERIAQKKWRYEYGLFLELKTLNFDNLQIDSNKLEQINQQKLTARDEQDKVIVLTETPRELLEKLDSYILKITTTK